MTVDPKWVELLDSGAHELLVWVGFGTIVGLTAKAVMPGRDPGGAIATLMMGVAGTVIGCGTLAFFMPDQRITPVSLAGFAAATGGAFLLLGFYRLFAGSLFAGMQLEDAWLHTARNRRRRRTIAREV